MVLPPVCLRAGGAVALLSAGSASLRGPAAGEDGGDRLPRRTAVIPSAVVGFGLLNFYYLLFNLLNDFRLTGKSQKDCEVLPPTRLPKASMSWTDNPSRAMERRNLDAQKAAGAAARPARVWSPADVPGAASCPRRAAWTCHGPRVFSAITTTSSSNNNTCLLHASYPRTCDTCISQC